MTLATALGTWLSVGAAGLGGQSVPPRPVVQLRVFVHATMSLREMEQAMATAGVLLESADVGLEWRPCGGAGDTCGQKDDAAVTVLLMPVAKRASDDVAAEVSHDRLTPGATVVVYIPSLAERLLTLHQSAAGRDDPALAALRLADLVGLAIAHEVGHAFGLSHATAGIMRARLGPDDFRALAGSRLVFTSAQVVTLRQSATARLAAVRSPGIAR